MRIWLWLRIRLWLRILLRLRIWLRLRVRLWVVVAITFVAVVAGEGDATSDQTNRAQHAERRKRWLIGAQRLFGNDFAGKRMLRCAGNRITGKPAVFLHADQRALSLAVVIFDDERGLLVAIKVDEQVIARTRSREAIRAKPRRQISELIVGTTNRINVLRTARAFEMVLGDGVASGVVDFKGNGAAHGGSRLRFYCRLH